MPYQGGQSEQKIEILFVSRFEGFMAIFSDFSLQALWLLDDLVTL
jgi:hypothetical protein